MVKLLLYLLLNTLCWIPLQRKVSKSQNSCLRPPWLINFQTCIWYSDNHCTAGNYRLNNFLFLCSDSKKITFIMLRREFPLPQSPFLSHRFPREPSLVEKNPSLFCFQLHNFSSNRIKTYCSAIPRAKCNHHVSVRQQEAQLYSHIHITPYLGAHVTLRCGEGSWGSHARTKAMSPNSPHHPKHPPLRYSPRCPSLCNPCPVFVMFST